MTKKEKLETADMIAKLYGRIKELEAGEKELAVAAAKMTTVIGAMTFRYSEAEFNAIVEEVNQEFANRKL